jgi:hypothetical protein
MNYLVFEFGSHTLSYVKIMYIARWRAVLMLDGGAAILEHVGVATHFENGTGVRKSLDSWRA